MFSNAGIKKTRLAQNWIAQRKKQQDRKTLTNNKCRKSVVFPVRG